MEWYYAKHGKQDGPVDVGTLRAKLQSGEVAPTDLAWKDGMAEWTPAGEIAELTASQSPTMAAGGVAQPGQMLAQPYAGGYVMPVAPTCGLAIASMVCGIVGLILCYMHGLVALPAVICGHIAIKQIDNSLVPMGGRGMAIAGLVTGYIGLAMQLSWIGLFGFAIISGL